MTISTTNALTASSHSWEKIRQTVVFHCKRRQQLCYDRELAPICSTAAENAGSRRAIAKAGFVSWHRILEVEF